MSALKDSFLARLSRLCRRADPLPAVALGFLLGLTAASALPALSSAALTPLPIWEAMTAAIGCELSIVAAIAAAGLTRLPALPKIPLFYRSFLWGYGSLRMYTAVGQGLLYFQYVIGCGLTILPLCCLARVATRNAAGAGVLSGPRLYDYLCRCLFYLGLVLLTLPLRLYGG